MEKQKKRILFLIHDLGPGGAEKVLVNLVNHLNTELFDVTVISLFGGGVNERFLNRYIRYRTVWRKSIPGNTKWMKLLTPSQLHRLVVKEEYDIEVSYLEGPSARIISGCNNKKTKLLCWIHIEQHTMACAAGAFRSFEESRSCYKRFNQIVCVSNAVRQDFSALYPDIHHIDVCYNVIETDKILALKEEPVEEGLFSEKEFKLVAVGKISKRKGFDRLARIVKRLRSEGFLVHLYALGSGLDQEKIAAWNKENDLTEAYTFLGYQTNPYKYMSRCDLFVCASLAEGFSTAATEALIVGTPVCTVRVSGMEELLGTENEWGIVTDNSEEALYEAIRKLIEHPKLLLSLKRKATMRGMEFLCDRAVANTEKILLSGGI